MEPDPSTSVETSSGVLFVQGDAPDYLPISAVAEFVYCPRNFYYRVAEAAEDGNAHTQEGKFQEERRAARETVRTEEKAQIRSFRLVSDTLKVTGIADAVEISDELIPVEYKKGPLRENPNDDVQVCLQAMALEEMLDVAVDTGYIYYVESRARRTVRLNSDLRNMSRQAVFDAYALLSAGELPDPVADRRCNGCSLERRCLPREVSFLKKGADAPRPRKPVPSANLGRVLYVDVPGAYLRSSGERFVVTREKEKLIDVPAINVDEIVICGRGNWSMAALRLALERGIPLALMSEGGRFVGRIAPGLSKNGQLRREQYECFRSDERRFELARIIVAGKLANMRAVLLRHRRSLGSSGDAEGVRIKLTAVLDRLGRTKVDLERCRDLDSLLGVEGFSARTYFEGFAALLKPPDRSRREGRAGGELEVGDGSVDGAELTFTFASRTRRPPRDPVNAMLSFGYSMLSKNIVGALEVAGLDPYVGFYHAAKYGRPALALDLLEEFRASVVDSLVLTIVNKGMLATGDFEIREQACYLNEKGRQKFFRAFEGKLGEEVIHPIFGYKVSYRRVLELQARFLAKVIDGEIEKYSPFLIR